MGAAADYAISISVLSSFQLANIR